MNRTPAIISFMVAFLAAAALSAQESNNGSPAAVSTAVLFADNGQELGNGDSWYIQLVDIDGDGHLDAYFEGAVWRNDGRGLFSKSGHSFGPVGRPAYFVDVNGDRLVDVICDDVVYFNDGKAGFAKKKPVPTDVPMLSAHLADLNGDGAIDLIVAGQYEDRIMLNNGKGSFHDTRTSLGGWSQCTYAVGDINGDHIADIFVAVPHTPPPKMVPAKDKIWLGDGRGGFTETSHNIEIGEHRGVVLADINGDVFADLLISAPRDSRVYFNDGKGNFTDSGQRMEGGRVVAGDFNSDGALDVFLARGGPLDKGVPNQIWLGNRQGQFTDSGLRLGNANSIAAAVGDLNGDGKPDLFVANVKNVVTREGAGFNEVWLNTTGDSATPRAPSPH